MTRQAGIEKRSRGGWRSKLEGKVTCSFHRSVSEVPVHQQMVQKQGQLSRGSLVGGLTDSTTSPYIITTMHGQAQKNMNIHTYTHTHREKRERERDTLGALSLSMLSALMPLPTKEKHKGKQESTISFVSTQTKRRLAIY